MISGFFCIVIALGLLMLPLPWIFSVVIAAAIHELCHYAAIRLCGGSVVGIQIGFRGAKMNVSGLTSMQELICALAGPVGGFLLLFLARWLPRIAICGCFQSLYNLIPIFPLDGGRILRCFLETVGLKHRVQDICDWVEALFLFLVVCMGGYGCFCLRLGLAPLLAALGIVFRVKRPCKVPADSLQ